MRAIFTGVLWACLAGAVAAATAAPAPDAAPPADRLKALLEDVAAGRGKLSGLRLKAWDRGAGIDVVVHGSGVCFVGDVQAKITPEGLTDAAKRLVKAGFADMPRAFGGVAGPGRRVPERLVRGVELGIGPAAKTVTQLAGGEQSKALADLVTGLHEMLKPLAAKGLDLGKLSLAQALAGLAKGDVAPEALSLALTVSPRRGSSRSRAFFRFTDAAATVFDGRYVDKPLTRAETEALARRIGTLLKGKDLEKMPRQLWWPDSLIGLSVSMRGGKARLSLSADVGPYNRKLKAAHPKAQEAFDEVIRGLLRIEQEMLKAKQSPPPAPEAAAAPAPGAGAAACGVPASGPADDKDVAALIAQLGNADWPVREAATKKLIAIGKPARAALEAKAKEKDLDPEVASRLEVILDRLPGDNVVTVAASGITISIAHSGEVIEGRKDGRRLWQTGVPAGGKDLSIDRGNVRVLPIHWTLDIRTGKVVNIGTQEGRIIHHQALEAVLKRIAAEAEARKKRAAIREALRRTGEQDRN